MTRIITILSLCAIMIFSGLGCKDRKMDYTVTLDVWGTFDNTSAFDDVFNEYRRINANVANINYHKYTLESYKKDVLNALASGTGPDVFMIHNSWMPDFVDKIVPVPSYMMTEAEFRNNFVDVVADDAVIGGQIYGVAPSVDSLGLYYNKDILNAAGITRPPATWEELDAMVPQLTVIDEFGDIVQSAVTLGTAYNTDGTINVNRAPDIITAMMMQSGVEMSRSDDVQITFAEPFSGANRGASVPGERVLNYYTRFATLGSDLYTWNKKQNYSIDEFFEGRAAMTINYSYHYDTIMAKNAKLNFAVADLPQQALETIGSQANYANYWMFVVAKNKQPIQPNDPNAVPITDEMRVHEAWQLLKSITFPSTGGFVMANYITQEPLTYIPEFDFTEKYLEMTGKPAARRDLIEKQKTDVRLGAFARGNLIARTWWRHEADAVDGIFYDMIDRVNTGQMSVNQSLQLGQQRTQQLQ